MPRWGKFEFGDFKKLADSFQKTLDERVIERFIQDFLLYMAYRAERKIKKRTPVGVYSNEVRFTTASGREVHFSTKRKRTGGQLRRNWHVGNVERRGNSYVVEIFNNTEYASYVEYGHRTGEDLTKWVEGRFMMTISMKEIERELPRYLEKRQMQLLEQIMNGRPNKGGGKE